MLMSISPECSCCHEAGHAVAWVANGDSLVLVVGYRDAPMTTDQQKIYYDSLGPIDSSSVQFQRITRLERHIAAKTIAIVVDHNCPCGGGIGKTVDFYRIKETCRGCMELLAGHVGCCLAGGAATHFLLKDQHEELQSTEDRTEAEKLLNGLVRDKTIRDQVWLSARCHAQDVVRKEETAIKALASALLQNGTLNGSDAEEIIRKNLANAV
jgi:hypothetical protein